MRENDIDTGYYVTGSDIIGPRGHSGYHISGGCILRGSIDTGYFVSGEIVYCHPSTDTGFWVSGGVVYGPTCDLPFLREEAL
ncbi:MAG TPA: hypothetical protein VH595_19545 [Verrucomicrobiae bacterium]|jgi:hypothetical protein|nr:hypothetical protein [Verrucomicrobiae bacterium]